MTTKSDDTTPVQSSQPPLRVVPDAKDSNEGKCGPKGGKFAPMTHR